MWWVAWCLPSRTCPPAGALPLLGLSRPLCLSSCFLHPVDFPHPVVSVIGFCSWAAFAGPSQSELSAVSPGSPFLSPGVPYIEAFCRDKAFSGSPCPLLALSSLLAAALASAGVSSAVGAVALVPATQSLAAAWEERRGETGDWRQPCWQWKLRCSGAFGRISRGGDSWALKAGTG